MTMKRNILFLFLAPSIIYTIFLLNGADLPKLSVLASERFWIYLVEHKRAISHGLLTWPGNIDTSVIYIERLLVRPTALFCAEEKNRQERIEKAYRDS